MTALAWLIPCALALGALGLWPFCGRCSRDNSTTWRGPDGGPYKTTMARKRTRRAKRP